MLGSGLAGDLASACDAEAEDARNLEPKTLNFKPCPKPDPRLKTPDLTGPNDRANKWYHHRSDCDGRDHGISVAVCSDGLLRGFRAHPKP